MRSLERSVERGNEGTSSPGGTTPAISPIPLGLHFAAMFLITFLVARAGWIGAGTWTKRDS